MKLKISSPSVEPVTLGHRLLVAKELSETGKRSDGKLSRFVWGEGCGNTPAARQEGAPCLYSTLTRTCEYGWASVRAQRYCVFDDIVS